MEQQAVMAKHLRTILGSKLLTKPLSAQPLKDLPSPEVQHTQLVPLFKRLCLSGFLMESFVPLTFVAGAEGAYSCKREEADSSPEPAGQEWQLCQLLFEL